MTFQSHEEMALGGRHRHVDQPERTPTVRLTPEIPGIPVRDGQSGRPLGAHEILHLQRVAGNAAVRQLLSDTDQADVVATEAPPMPIPGQVHASQSETAAWAFSAQIPRGDTDAEPGAEESGAPDPSAVTEALAASVGPAPSVAEGETASLPDLVMPPSMGIAETDSVTGAIAYAPTVTRAGAVSPFGATKWNVFNMTGITVTSNPGAFTVQATLQNPITYNVAAGGRNNIASENDPALTHTNYPTAAADLTPNIGDLGGRPPRTQFWAEDLTLRHEGFHANERRTFGGQGATAAQAWLNSQTATDVAGVQNLLTQVPNRVITYSQANMAMPGKEQRAYGDGAPLYLARANAITAKGGRGEYPGAPAGSGAGSGGGH